MSEKKTILVCAAHPDDELLGCAGTLLRHVEAGDKVIIVIMTEGESSRYEGTTNNRIKKAQSKLRQAAIDAHRELGAKESVFFNNPDNQMDSVPLLEIVKQLEPIIKTHQPDVIYTHHSGDVNIDHFVTCKAVITAARPLPDQSVTEIYAFETLSSTEWQPPSLGSTFEPNRFVDISEYLKKKIEILRFYDTEMREFPHPRSYAAVEHLARWRGSSAGLAAAEAFITLRKIEKI